MVARYSVTTWSTCGVSVYKCHEVYRIALLLVFSVSWGSPCLWVWCIVRCQDDFGGLSY